MTVHVSWMHILISYLYVFMHVTIVAVSLSFNLVHFDAVHETDQYEYCYGYSIFDIQDSNCIHWT